MMKKQIPAAIAVLGMTVAACSGGGEAVEDATAEPVPVEATVDSIEPEETTEETVVTEPVTTEPIVEGAPETTEEVAEEVAVVIAPGTEGSATSFGVVPISGVSAVIDDSLVDAIARQVDFGGLASYEVLREYGWTNAAPFFEAENASLAGVRVLNSGDIDSPDKFDSEAEYVYIVQMEEGADASSIIEPFIASINEFHALDERLESRADGADSDRTFATYENESAENKYSEPLWQITAEQSIESPIIGAVTVSVNTQGSGLPVVSQAGQTELSRLQLDLPATVTFANMSYDFSSLSIGTAVTGMASIKTILTDTSYEDAVALAQANFPEGDGWSWSPSDDPERQTFGFFTDLGSPSIESIIIRVTSDGDVEVAYTFDPSFEV